MIKTSLDIEQDLYDALLEVFTPEVIGGELYKSEQRPINSKKEDAMIIVSSGDAEQIQEGRFRVHIYVPDIDNGSGEGSLVPDKTRLCELASLDQTVIDLLNSSLTEYSFNRFEMTSSIAAEGIEQHFVNIAIKYKRITF